MHDISERVSFMLRNLAIVPCVYMDYDRFAAWRMRGL
jgi:hypothetical protein